MAILRHVALYRLTLPAVVAKIFPSIGTAAKAGTALNKLVQPSFGWLTKHTHRPEKAIASKGFPGSLTYYTLSTAGAKQAGVPRDRAKPLGSKAISDSLSTLWFCCMGENRRYRLELKEWSALFGKDAPDDNTTLCVADAEAKTATDDGECVVYRVYPTTTDSRESLKRLCTLISEARAKPILGQWVESREYGFAVLTQTDEKRDDLQKHLREPYRGDVPLVEQARVIVATAATPETLKHELRKSQ